MSDLEIVATMFAFAYIALAIGEYRLSWPISVLSSSLYIFLFWSSELYFQSGLQVFFVLSALYGWLAWNPNRAEVVRISYLSLKDNLLVILLWGIFVIPGSWFLKDYMTSPSPILDSLTTVASIAATFLAAHKKIENWWYWIVINFLSIWMFIDRGLILTSFVYLGLLCMAIMGLIAWRGKLTKVKE